MAKQEESVQVSTPAPYAMLQRRYAKAPEFVSRRIADEMLLLPIRQNLGDLESIYTLNEVAARVWELLGSVRSQRFVTWSWRNLWCRQRPLR